MKVLSLAQNLIVLEAMSCELVAPDILICAPWNLKKKKTNPKETKAK